MVRTMTAAFFQVAVDEGKLPCADCGDIDISSAQNINEAVDMWNDHVQSEHGETQ